MDYDLMDRVERTTDTVLVIPSIRADSWNRFVKEWTPKGLFDEVDVYLVEDNPVYTFASHRYGKGALNHFCWLDIEKMFQDRSWIIPRRSDTVRSFGYYLAWYRGYEYIWTLDDDCYPYKYSAGAFSDIKTHKEALQGKAQSKWFNTLRDVKPRGIPYYNQGKVASYVNHGLWEGVLDFDAPTQLVDPRPEDEVIETRIVPTGQYFPMCGMNVMWRREATVLMYHLLMGQIEQKKSMKDEETKLQKLLFDRFGDIWCGIFMKKIADILSMPVTSGIPYIHHDRASNPFANLKKEAYGLEVNEKLWEYVDKFTPFISLGDKSASLSPWVQYAALGEHIRKYNEFPEHEQYFKDLGTAMITWAHLFEKDPTK
jgi:reversibly glycosylated polypeptide / UDP-arabinopyranose mutase